MMDPAQEAIAFDRWRNSKDWHECIKLQIEIHTAQIATDLMTTDPKDGYEVARLQGEIACLNRLLDAPERYFEMRRLADERKTRGQHDDGDDRRPNPGPIRRFLNIGRGRRDPAEV